MESKPSSGQESPTRAPSPVPHSQPDWIADLVTADPQHIFSAPSLGLEIALDADAPYSLAAAGENFWDTVSHKLVLSLPAADTTLHPLDADAVS